jgi:hypothetical protein
MAQDRFFEHPRIKAPTSQGDIELPVLYRDASAFLAFFSIDRRRAADALSSTPYAPVQFGTGFALGGLGFFDYRDCALGPYRECALVVVSAPRAAKPPALPVLDMLRGVNHRALGYYVLDLPVTTGLADVAGRELWGLPKFVTTIDFELGRDAARCAVHAPGGGEPIVVVAGKTGHGLTLPAMSMVVDSVVHGEPTRTVVDVRGRMRTSLGGGIEVKVGSGSPMASRIAALGLRGARPVVVQACDHAQFVLHGPTPELRARSAA